MQEWSCRGPWSQNTIQGPGSYHWPWLACPLWTILLLLTNVTYCPPRPSSSPCPTTFYLFLLKCHLLGKACLDEPFPSMTHGYLCQDMSYRWAGSLFYSLLLAQCLAYSRYVCGMNKLSTGRRPGQTRTAMYSWKSLAQDAWETADAHCWVVTKVNPQLTRLAPRLLEGSQLRA